jgi:hypothetical protein
MKKNPEVEKSRDTVPLKKKTFKQQSINLTTGAKSLVTHNILDKLSID